MNSNSEVIISLCSHVSLPEDLKAYEPAEWSKLAEKLMEANLQPSELAFFSENEYKSILNFNSEEILRIKKLIDRGGGLAFELEKYSNMGINIITRADVNYPKMLKSRLGKSCPPLFYYAGDLTLLDRKCVGFVGSRNVDDDDITFTDRIVSTINNIGYDIVSGGAKGVDTISSLTSIKNGRSAVEFIADSLVRKIRVKANISAIQNKQLLIMSAINPDTGFTSGIAMMRNRYIYAQSLSAVVVKSDYKKGGTWSGATDCIRHEVCPVFCRDISTCKGNQELIKLGAIPIDENWDGNITALKNKKGTDTVQLSFFDE